MRSSVTMAMALLAGACAQDYRPPQLIFQAGGVVAHERQPGDTVCSWSATLTLTGGTGSTFATVESATVQFRDSLDMDSGGSAYYSEENLVGLFGSKRVQRTEVLETGTRGPIPAYVTEVMTLGGRFSDGEAWGETIRFPCQRAQLETLRSAERATGG